MPQSLLLLTGFALLISGADLIVGGASALARRLRLPPLVIGLTLVALGTTSPELVVSVMASWQGSGALALGNALGSVIANVLLILGMSAIVAQIRVRQHAVWRNIAFALLAAVVVGLLGNDRWLLQADGSALSRLDGALLVALTAVYFGVTFKRTHRRRLQSLNLPDYPWMKAMAMFVGGLAAVVAGSQWIIQGALALAAAWGVSQTFIGLTIVALGTSLPELATAAVAVHRHRVDLAIGNIVGANILNLLLIIGVSAALRPLPFPSALNFDLAVATIATVLLFLFLVVGQRFVLQRWHGLVMVTLYVWYLAIAAGRG